MSELLLPGKDWRSLGGAAGSREVGRRHRGPTEARWLGGSPEGTKGTVSQVSSLPPKPTSHKTTVIKLQLQASKVFQGLLEVLETCYTTNVLGGGILQNENSQPRSFRDCGQTRDPLSAQRVAGLLYLHGKLEY